MQGRGPQVRGEGLDGCGWRKEPRIKPELLGELTQRPQKRACLLNKGFGDMPKAHPPFTEHLQVLRLLLRSFPRQLSASSEMSASRVREGSAALTDSPLGDWEVQGICSLW